MDIYEVKENKLWEKEFSTEVLMYTIVNISTTG